MPDHLVEEKNGWTYFECLSNSCGTEYIWKNFWVVRLFVPVCLQTWKWQRWQCLPGSHRNSGFLVRCKIQSK